MRRTRAFQTFAGPLLLLLATSTAAGAQEGGVAPGDTVRVSRARLAPDAAASGPTSWEGVVVEVGAGELRLTDGAGTHTLLIGPDSRLEVRRGTRPWGPIKGALLGAGAAVAAGLLWEGSDSLERRGCELVDRSANGSPIYRCERDRRNLDQWWIVTGAVGGFALGSLIRVPRWVDARAGGPAVGIGAGSGGTLTLAVGLPVGGPRR